MNREEIPLLEFVTISQGSFNLHKQIRTLKIECEQCGHAYGVKVFKNGYFLREDLKCRLCGFEIHIEQ